MDRYSAAALLNGCIWGLMGFFTRRMTALGLTPIGMLFIRFLVAGVLYAAVILCRDPSLFRIRWKDVPLFIAIGALGQFFLAYFYYSAIRVMSISTACALNYTSPLFVMILAWILFRERDRRAHV